MKPRPSRLDKEDEIFPRRSFAPVLAVSRFVRARLSDGTAVYEAIDRINRVASYPKWAQTLS
jgi:hypothetical protein